MGKYKLLFNTAYCDYTGDDEVEIGKVIDTETDEDVFYIYYNKNLYNEEGYHTCIDIYENEDKEFPIAKTDDLHRECLFSNPDVFLCLMLHEYGHYLNGDLNLSGLTNQMIQEERMQCIMENRVMKVERNADIFAISHSGKRTFIRAMNYMIRKRRERADEPLYIKQMAIREFELRKKAALEEETN